MQQFKIDYQFGSEAPSENNPYSEYWHGPFIPASAKTVKVSIVWIYPMTGERVILFTKETQPEQMPPDIYCSNSIAELIRYDAPTNTYFVAIRGIGVDFEVPLDANNTDTNASKSVKATEPAWLDYNSSAFMLRVYRDDEPVEESSWTPNPGTIKIVKGDFDSASGAFPITIAITGLPPFGTRLLGTITIRAQATIVNQKAGANAMSTDPPCVILINLPINTHITNAEQTLAMQLVAKSYIPTTTKTVRLAGSEFLKRQYWLSSRLRNQDFSLFTANEATIQAVRNSISPSPVRTPALEFAEQQCTTTDDIKRRISKNQPIPTSMIDEGGDPTACEMVRQFYAQVMAYEAVRHVVMLVTKPKGGKTAELLGALALGGRDKLIIQDYDLVRPLHVYSLEDLKALQIGGSTTLYDMLAKQLTNLDTGLLERNVTVETTEVVPVSGKGSAGKKGK